MEDKSLKSFVFLSVSLIAFLLCILLAIYMLLDLQLNDLILSRIQIILSVISISLVVLIVFILLGAIHIYKTKRVKKGLVFLSPLIGRILLPSLLAFSEIFKRQKNPIKSFYIQLNNILALSGRARNQPQKVLILLPHCIQNSKCGLKVTNKTENCNMCMKCAIGHIRQMAQQYRNIAVEVATGGTAARNAVQKLMPDFIIAVACETDLTTGISDIKDIPVYGVLNKRPNGPCIDTQIDLKELREALENILDPSRNTSNVPVYVANKNYQLTTKEEHPLS